MSGKIPLIAPTDTWSYDFYAVFDTTIQEWVLGMTYYENGDALFTVTLTRPALVTAVTLTTSISHSTLLLLKKGKLVLPHMGDYEIDYHLEN